MKPVFSLPLNEQAAPEVPSFLGKLQASAKGNSFFILYRKEASTQHHLNTFNVTRVERHLKDRM